MPARYIHRGLIGTIVILAVVGVADSLISREPDLLVLFIAVLACGLGLALAIVADRRSVPVRVDLAKWLRDRSTLTGEDPGRLADRAIATYRLQLGEAGAPSTPDAE
jgi:hypothetical protein